MLLDYQGSCLPAALTQQRELVAVQSLQTAPMAHADDRAVGHPFPYQPVDGVLHTLVQRRGGFVEKGQCGPRDQDASEGKPLLLAR